MLHATGPLPHRPNVNPFGIIMRLLANILFAPHSRRSFAPLSLSSPRVTLAGGVINFYLLQQRVVSSAIMLAFSFYLAMSQTCTRCATGRLKQTDKGHKRARGGKRGTQSVRPWNLWAQIDCKCIKCMPVGVGTERGARRVW